MDGKKPSLERSRYELRFHLLFDVGRSFAFPCDASGQVDMASLSDVGQRSYLRVCAGVGREVSLPEVRLTSDSAGR
ncbi:hypothetical protein [Aquabacterium humicola]|uniref:hypothetical protein n=1 Tax=Aquabacterium humicola TaxID=3237377 RepID=UPI0025433FBB|nr:hypothetical protein [Rubrivivax pictus]